MPNALKRDSNIQYFYIVKETELDSEVKLKLKELKWEEFVDQGRIERKKTIESIITSVLLNEKEALICLPFKDCRVDNNHGLYGTKERNELFYKLCIDYFEKKWNVGTSQFGRMWYDNGEYHMSSKPQTFIVMYAPSDDYSTENATVKVSARSVDGTVPSDGFGLLVHGGSSKTKKIEDYVLLIYPGEEPQYQIIMHKDGNQSELVPRTKSNAIRSGSSPNELEVRIKGLELSFYANGQYLTKITDSANYRQGRAGFYTSDATDVAFDNLEIDR